MINRLVRKCQIDEKVGSLSLPSTNSEVVFNKSVISAGRGTVMGIRQVLSLKRKRCIKRDLINEFSRKVSEKNKQVWDLSSGIIKVLYTIIPNFCHNMVN